MMMPAHGVMIELLGICHRTQGAFGCRPEDVAARPETDHPNLTCPPHYRVSVGYYAVMGTTTRSSSRRRTISRSLGLRGLASMPRMDEMRVLS